ncbi:hypothetical protein VHEMI01200 [[Torrubiella] hemipterigena]|uniref:Uncharacterized protein n=1 Tax=[Torrubiella] hemipterigena TaxID=1531966 RepID=A0A0A1SL86_9HYPO|nr:hypothetical protein VHEMI01200 [[Torrubiella] hemipterigena]
MACHWNATVEDLEGIPSINLSGWCVALVNDHLIMMHTERYSTDYLLKHPSPAGTLFHSGISVKSKEFDAKFMVLRRIGQLDVAEDTVKAELLEKYAKSWGGYLVKGEEKDFYMKEIEEARAEHEPGPDEQEAGERSTTSSTLTITTRFTSIAGLQVISTSTILCLAIYLYYCSK